MVSDIHIVLNSLFNTFRQLSGGTPLSPPRPPCNRSPYDARGLQRMLTPSPLTSEFVGMAGYAPTFFHDLVDDEVESDGSSIGDVMAPDHPLSRECAMADASGQPPEVVESLQTHTPLEPRV